MSNDELPNAKVRHKKFRAAVRDSWRQEREPSAAAATIEAATDNLSDHPFGKSPPAVFIET
jgi:hypothetical protein